MNAQEFHQQASSATDSLYTLADFTRCTESLLFDCPNSSALERYRAAWFELEIVNAAALAEWEADGRPKKWDEKWEQIFKGEAIAVIDQMLKVAEEMWT